MRKVIRRRKARGTVTSRRGNRRSRRVFGRRSKKASARPSRTFIGSKSPFKDSCYAKLTYVSTYGVANLAGAYSFQVFSGNSCFDPDATGVGHQPYFYDQYCALNGPYFDYRVLGSSIKVTAIPYDESSTTTGYRRGILNLSVVPNLGAGDLVVATSSTDFDDLSCMTYAKSKLVDINWGSLKNHTITHYMATGKLEGKTVKQVEADGIYAAQYNANPSQRWYWHIYVGDPLNDVTTYAYVRASVTYYVKFEHRANTAAS